MEFKNIQRNHPVYLLDKQTVEVKEGKVVDNQPHINTGIATISSSGQSMRDVTIEVEGKQTIYTIPEHLGVTFAGETVLATDKADLLPEVGKLVNEAEDAAKQAFPMIHVLPAKSVINWDTVIVGNQQKLSLVVIHETVSSRDQGGFKFETKNQYRVLRLEENNGNHVFTIQIYTQSPDGSITEGHRTILS